MVISEPLFLNLLLCPSVACDFSSARTVLFSNDTNKVKIQQVVFCPDKQLLLYSRVKSQPAQWRLRIGQLYIRQKFGICNAMRN